MPEVHVARAAPGRDFTIRINGAHPTFILRSDRIRQRALAELSPLVEDFLDIAAAVFAADSHESRGGAAGSNMGSEWSRDLRLTIPVRQASVWSQPEVATALSDLVAFMTGDTPAFDLVQADPEPSAEPFLDLDPAAAAFKADHVILFSGGLDSFAGALETPASGREKVILVSHRSAQKVLPRQASLASYLINRFPGRCLHVGIEARLSGVAARETTQRSRTILFAALAIAVAGSFGAKRISFFENGVVSHNLPISPQVAGTTATRTTHPLVLRKLNDLLERIYPDAPRIMNEYAWLTKRDVVERIARFGAVEQIKTAVSCAIVREQTTLHTHCGSCSQCLDRRFAILAAGLAEHDPVESYKTDVIFGPRHEGRGQVMAVEWTRHALSKRNFTVEALLETYGLEFARIRDGHPDLDVRAVVEQTLGMHRRHGDDIQQVLERAVKDHAAAIAARDLEPLSLIMLHLGAATALPTTGQAAVAAAKRLPVSLQEVDVIPTSEGGLTVAFDVDDGDHVVVVMGLCRLTGPPARVAHCLKPIFDEDRAAGRRPTDHRFVHAHLQPNADMSKDAARQNVRRCRSILATAYRDLHGKPPRRPLLIETQASNGYRLDPWTRLTSADQVKETQDPASK